MRPQWHCWHARPISPQWRLKAAWRCYSEFALSFAQACDFMACFWFKSWLVQITQIWNAKQEKRRQNLVGALFLEVATFGCGEDECWVRTSTTHTGQCRKKKKSATWFPFPVHLSIWRSGVVYGLLLCSHFWHMPCNYTCCSNAMYNISEWHPRAQDNENATKRQGLQRINSFAYCVHEQQQQQQLRGCRKWLCTLLHYFPANVKFLAWLLLFFPLLRRLRFVPLASW